MPSIDNRILEMLARHDGLSPDDIRLEKLPGDASDRRFYRARLPEGKSYIIMQLETGCPAPEDPDTLPYINILYHLDLCRANVPKLHFYDPAVGLLLLEDLGETTLEDEIRQQGITAARPLYRQAIDELLKIQIIGTRKRCEHCIAFHRSFDEEKFFWELNFFREHTLEGYLERRISSGDMQRLEEAFRQLCRTLAAEPKFFTHRDYHSRNLMVRDGRIGVIDFQDARLGPLQYDLSSLLRDSYVVLPEDLREELIEYYLQEKDRMEGTVSDRDHFRKVFDLVSVQRNLKAAGTFGYMAVIKGKKRYLQYLPDTFGYVRENLEKHRELQELKEALLPYLPEHP